MIIDYAAAFGMHPEEVADKITELQYWEWYCRDTNKKANEIFQSQPKK
jgi:hypothetical protein